MYSAYTHTFASDMRYRLGVRSVGMCKCITAHTFVKIVVGTEISLACEVAGKKTLEVVLAFFWRVDCS